MHIYRVSFLFSVHAAAISDLFCRICASLNAAQSRHDVRASGFRSDQYRIFQI